MLFVVDPVAANASTPSSATEAPQVEIPTAKRPCVQDRGTAESDIPQGRISGCFLRECGAYSEHSAGYVLPPA